MSRSSLPVGIRSKTNVLYLPTSASALPIKLKMEFTTHTQYKGNDVERDSNSPTSIGGINPSGEGINPKKLFALPTPAIPILKW